MVDTDRSRPLCTASRECFDTAGILTKSKDDAFSIKTEQPLVLAHCALRLNVRTHEWQDKKHLIKCVVSDDLIFQQHSICCHQILISKKYFKLKQLPPNMVKTVTD